MAIKTCVKKGCTKTHAPWSRHGNQVISRCETICQYCIEDNLPKKNKKNLHAWFLRRHVRSCHCGKPGFESLVIPREWNEDGVLVTERPPSKAVKTKTSKVKAKTATKTKAKKPAAKAKKPTAKKPSAKTKPKPAVKTEPTALPVRSTRRPRSPSADSTIAVAVEQKPLPTDFASLLLSSPAPIQLKIEPAAAASPPAALTNSEAALFAAEMAFPPGEFAPGDSPTVAAAVAVARARYLALKMSELRVVDVVYAFGAGEWE